MIIEMVDLDNLRHMVGAKDKNPGYRNVFAPGGENVASMKRLEVAGLVIQGRVFVDDVHYYHATQLGCRAIGLSNAAIKRALRTA